MLLFADLPSPMRLMLLAARSPLAEGECVELAATAADAGMDWHAFLDVTLHHQVGSLVYETLERERISFVPRWLRQALRDEATANALRALRSFAETERIVESFAARGISCAVLKGLPLSQRLFGSPNARQVGDIDLLTSSGRLPEQTQWLEELGFARTNPRGRLTPRRITSFAAFWKDFTFVSRETGFELDLHWRLFNNRFHAGNRILDQAEFTTEAVFGTPVRVLSPRDQFLYVAVHGLTDAWTYLKSLSDVAAILRQMDPAEVEAALERARALGMARQVSAAVHFANDWMGAGIESAWLLPAKDAVGVAIRRQVERQLLAHDFRPHRNFRSPMDWLRLEIKLVPGLRSVAEIARRFIWRPRVWSRVDLPDRLFWLYGIVGLLVPPRVHVPGTPKPGLPDSG